MSTILRASLPAEQFALAETLATIPAAEFTVVRFVAHERDRVTPLLRVTNADADRVAAALSEDETTDEARLVSRRDSDSLFQVDLTSRVRFVTHALVEEDGTLLSAHGRSDAWQFGILFPNRDAVSSTYEACGEYDVDVERIHPIEDAPSLGGAPLTDEQFVTVMTALDSGYYEVPRRRTLEDLASELDVSHQALSERLRRGHRTLVETVVAQ